MTRAKQGATIYPAPSTVDYLCGGRLSTTRLSLAVNLFGVLIAEQPDCWAELPADQRETFQVLVQDLDFSYANLHLAPLLASRAELLGYKALGEKLSQLSDLDVWAMIFRHIRQLPGQIQREAI